MHRVIAVLVVLAITRGAHADGKLAELATGYDKEVASCRVHLDGLAKVLTGAQAMLAEAADEALAADVHKLEQARDTVAGYCAELDATLALLRADPNATYKQLEHQLDDHDNKIRAGRKASKQVLDDIAPIIQRLIPRINARVGAADKRPPRTPTEFPSGRAIKLPAWPGTWRVSGTRTKDVADYSEGSATLSLSVRAFSDATCEQQAKAQGDHTGAAWDHAAPKPDAKPPTWSLAYLPNAAWKLAYTQGERFLQLECVATKAGGFIVTLDEPDRARLDRSAGELAADMVAAQLAKP